MKRNQLRHLHLTKLALVDRPANPHSMVVIAKRDAGVLPLTFTEVQRLMRPVLRGAKD
jgi:hypothetical protein